MICAGYTYLHTSHAYGQLGSNAARQQTNQLEITLGDTSDIWEMSGDQCIRDGSLALAPITKF